MIEKDKLKKYAKLLMFDMEETQYDTLLKEFDILLKQMDLIGKFDNIKDVKPMTFPFDMDYALLREDVVSSDLKVEDAFKNAKDVKNGCIVVPKVVE